MRSWNRASFEYHTHPPNPPRRVTQRDFLVPLYRDRLKLLAGRALCGVAISVLHVWTVMWIVSVMLNRPLAPWIWLAMALVAAAATVLLFHWALARERPTWSDSSSVLGGSARELVAYRSPIPGGPVIGGALSSAGCSSSSSLSPSSP